jgi:hypothetical protein
MPRKKISDGGSPNLLRKWERMATMSFTQFVTLQSGLSASELEECFSIGTYGASKNLNEPPKRTGRQWMRYISGESSMSIDTLDRCCNKAEDLGWHPEYLGRERVTDPGRFLAHLAAYLDFWTAQQKLSDALAEFEVTTKALSCLAFVSDHRQVRSDMPKFASTSDALAKPNHMVGDAQPTYTFEDVVSGFSSDIQNLYLDPIDPTGVFKRPSLSELESQFEQIRASRRKKMR